MIALIKVTNKPRQSIGVSSQPLAIGTQGPKGDKGDPGYTPVRGVDYWTDADKAEIASYIDGKNADTNAYLEDRIDGVDLKLPQELTDEQKVQARENIGAASEEFLKTITDEVSTLSQDFWQLSENASVRYDAEQTLTPEQKVQAMQNIGAIHLFEALSKSFIYLRDNQAVRYDTEQTLADEQKAKARANIGALTESEMIAYVEESILGGAW